MAAKLTKEIEHAISWLAAEFKFLKQLYDDLEIIQKEPIKEQEKNLKKDLRVIRFIGKSERRAGRDIQDIIQRIKKDRQKEILPENVKKQLDEVEIPANQLLKEGSLYVGKLKEQLNSIRTRVVLEEKYPKEETRAVVQQEIDQLKNKVRHLMTWIAALDAALKKVELSVEKMNSINEINKRLAKHAEKISELWGAEWPFDVKELSEQVILNNEIFDEIDRVQQTVILSHGGMGTYQYNFRSEPVIFKYLEKFRGPNYHIILSEKLNRLFDELLLLSKDLQVLLRNNKDNLTKEERFMIGSFLSSAYRLSRIKTEEVSLEKLRKHAISLIRKNGISVEFVNKSNFGKVVPYGSIFHGLSVPLPVYEQKYILTRVQVGKSEMFLTTFEFKAIYHSLIEVLTRGFSSYSKQMAQGAVNFNVSGNPAGGSLEGPFHYISPFGFVFKNTLNRLLESPIVPDEILEEIDFSRYEIGEPFERHSVKNKKRLQELLGKYGFNFKTDSRYMYSDLFDRGPLLTSLVNAVIFRALRKGNKTITFDDHYGLRAICINNKKQIESIPITVNMIKKIIINENFINYDFRGKEAWRHIVMPEIAILKQIFQ